MKKLIILLLFIPIASFGQVNEITINKIYSLSVKWGEERINKLYDGMVYYDLFNRDLYLYEDDFSFLVRGKKFWEEIKVDYKLIDDLYKRAKTKGYKKSYAEFRKSLNDEEEVIEDNYNYLKNFKDGDHFEISKHEFIFKLGLKTIDSLTDITNDLGFKLDEQFYNINSFFELEKLITNKELRKNLYDYLLLLGDMFDKSFIEFEDQYFWKKINNSKEIFIDNISNNPFGLIKLYSLLKDQDYKNNFNIFLEEINYDSKKGLSKLYKIDKERVGEKLISSDNRIKTFEEYKAKLADDYYYVKDQYNLYYYFSEINPMDIRDWFIFMNLITGVKNLNAYYFEEALNNYNDENYDKAIDICSKILNNGAKNYTYNNELYIEDDFYGAVYQILSQSYRKSEAQNPNKEIAIRKTWLDYDDTKIGNYIQLGRLYSRDKDYLKAIVILSKAIELMGEGRDESYVSSKTMSISYLYNADYDIYVYRGVLKNKMGDRRGAIKDFKVAVNWYKNRIDKGEFFYQYSYEIQNIVKDLAVNTYQLDDVDGAIKILKDFISNYYKKNDHAVLKSLLGELLIYNGDFNAGCKYLSEAGEEGNSKSYEIIKEKCN